MKFADVKNDIAFRKIFGNEHRTEVLVSFLNAVLDLQWTYFIKNAKNLKVIPDGVDDEGLKAAYFEADRHRWKKEEIIAYDNAAIKEQDDRGILELAEERAMERGMDKGRKEERAKAEAEKVLTILSLKKLGIPSESIAAAVNKSIEDVNQILAKHQ